MVKKKSLNGARETEEPFFDCHSLPRENLTNPHPVVIHRLGEVDTLSCVVRILKEDDAILIESIHRVSIEPERFGVSGEDRISWRGHDSLVS